MSQKATINTIALRAGVSRGTVDRVLNQRPHVRQDIYERVVRVMKELNYVPPTEQQAKALGLTMPVPEPLKLGVLLSSERGYFYREIMRGIKDAQDYLRPYLVDVIVDACETALPDEAIERIDGLLEKEVAGFALCTKDHKTIAQKIDNLSAEGIPVVTFNSDVSNCKRLCFVGQDLLRGGRVAGELMNKYLRPEDHLLIAVGNPEFSSHRIRLQGFCDRLDEIGFPKESRYVIETYNDYTMTYQKVSEALRADPALRGIYMANRSVTGCAEAIRETRRQGEIHVISHDITDSSRRLLQRGEIDLVISQDLHRQGYHSLVVLQEYLQKHIFPQLEIPPIHIVCSENMIEYN